MLEHCAGANCSGSSHPLSHNLHRCKAPKVMTADRSFAVDGCSPSKPQSISRRLIERREPSVPLVNGRSGDCSPTTTYEFGLGGWESGSQWVRLLGQGAGRVEIWVWVRVRIQGRFEGRVVKLPHS